MKEVLFFIIEEKASLIIFSVLVSIDEVASSRIRIYGEDSITLVIERSCFSPSDSSEAFSERTVS